MTETEKRLCVLYARMLNLDVVQSDDDIYTLGCDSMQAVRIALEIEREFRISLPLEIMESSGRIDDVAAWIDRQPSS